MEAIINLIEREEYELALTSLVKALEGDGYNIELLTLSAHVSFKLEKHDEAIEKYHSLINLVPGKADYYAGRALAYHNIGEHRLALADFTYAITLEPENGYRYASRAFIKSHLGDHTGAIEDYNKAIELDPEDAVSINNRGIAEEKLGRQTVAEQSFARADLLAGIDNQKNTQTVKGLRTKEPKGRASKVDLKLFSRTIKNLFVSAKERRKFLDFLLKRQ